MPIHSILHLTFVVTEYEHSYVGMLKFTDDFNIEALVSSLDMDTSVHDGPIIKRMLKHGTLLLPGQKLNDVKMNKKILATWIFVSFHGRLVI